MSAAAHPLATLLVAEDEVELRQLMARILEEIGYQVVTADDGAMAWELLQRTPGSVHAVITDVAMPRMTGLELAARVATLPNAPAVVLVSGFAHELGDLNYPVLSKPFRHEQLAAVVAQVLATRRATSYAS